MELSGSIMRKAIELGMFDVPELSEVTDKHVRRPATRILCKLSSNPADGLRWLKTEFYYDHETQLPLHFILYDFDGELSGEYAFTEFRLNVPLTDADFVLKKR
jgi:negative regulator of sigma E activity